MTTLEANIDVIRENGKLKSVSVALPVWTKEQEDGFLAVDIPMLGIKTFAKDENDTMVAIKEAIILFCINSEDFGHGLETELKLAGWNFSSRNYQDASLYYGVSDEIIEQIMQTGDPYSETFMLPAC